MGIMITYRGCNNEPDNPMHIAHKHEHVHYSQQNKVRAALHRE